MNKPNIVLAIQEQASAFLAQTACPPQCVYLGFQEMEELQEHFRYIGRSPMPRLLGDGSTKINDLTIYGVVCSSHLSVGMTPQPRVDQSDAADARRLRWMLDGHGYFMQTGGGFCGHGPCSLHEQDAARRAIDEAMAEEDAST